MLAKRPWGTGPTRYLLMGADDSLDNAPRVQMLKVLLAAEASATLTLHDQTACASVCPSCQ